jgi:hypothetical protein
MIPARECRDACACAPSPAALLVALWPAVAGRLGLAERLLGPAGKFALPPAPLVAGPPALRQMGRVLDAARGDDWFWVDALSVVKALDRHLDPRLLPAEPIAAYDRKWLLRARNAYYADLSEEAAGVATGEQAQSRSMLLYARRHVVIPAGQPHEIRLVEPAPPRSAAARLDSALAVRARERRAHVLTAAAPANVKYEPGRRAPDRSVVLHRPENADEISAAALHALELARVHDACLVVLPEFGLPADRLWQLTAWLSEQVEEDPPSPAAAHEARSSMLAAVFVANRAPYGQLPDDGDCLHIVAPGVGETVVLGDCTRLLSQHRD